MVGLHLYVEGGGAAHSLHTECRRGFRKFLERAGLGGNMPRIVACGDRRQAYEAFCTCLTTGENAAMLLVDSESALTATSPWGHLLKRQGDQWATPGGARDDHCHLMVQCMESWLLADRATLARFFGQGFAANALPAATRHIEEIDKATIYAALAKATAHCKTKAEYGKGPHSFKLLALVDPSVVVAVAPSARRFIGSLKQAMHAGAA